MNYDNLNKLNIDNDFKFIIITGNEKIDKNIFLSFFDGLINNIKCIDIENGLLLIYNAKERPIKYSDYYDSISFDLGVSFKFFEGFKIRKDNVSYLKYVLELFYKYLDNESDSYYKVKDIILKTKDSEEIKELKKIVLDKYNDDPYFIGFVKGLFENDLNVSKAANNLYMHRNTINNKLESIENDTSLRLQKFGDAVAMHILIKEN